MSQNKLKELAFMIVDKDTGDYADYGHVYDTARNAKTRYSYIRQKGQMFNDQTQHICIQLINPIKLHQMLDDLGGSFNNVDDLILAIKEQIDLI